jgi:hypothetical protein
VRNRSNLLLLLLLIVKMVLAYVLIHPAYELHRDEFLHLDMSRHPGWGYISVPPFTSWLAWLIAQLGNGVFWVKFVPAFFGALTILLVWKLVEQLGGGLYARVLAGLALLFSILLRINLLFQPNSFDIFFWTLLYTAVILYLKTDRKKWIYLAGVAAGLGMLAKYNLAFCLAGLVPALLVSSHRRKLFRKPVFIAALVAGLIVLPNILWQVRNDFPTARQLRELADTQLVHVRPSDFLKEQFLFFLNSIFVLLAGFIGLARYRPFRPYRFLLLAFAISFGLFVYLKAKGYYAIGLYPVMLAFGAVYLEQGLQTGWKRYLRPVSIALVLLLFIPFLLIAIPMKGPETLAGSALLRDAGALRWEDGKDHQLPQDFADMRGWKELARKVDGAVQSLPANGRVLVFCDNYGQAGAVNFYSKTKGMQAVSFNADYIYWMDLQTPIRHLVLVKEAGDDDPGRTREQALFQRVQVTDSIADPFARERGTRIYVLQEAKADINAMLSRERATRLQKN